MTDSPLQLCLLALISFCAVIITFSSLLTAGSIWKTSQRLTLLLSHGDEAVLEARRTLGSAHDLLARTNLFADFVQRIFGRLGKVHRARSGGNHRIQRHVTNKRRG